MFRNWGFLLTEIWFLLLLAALLGLFVGWLIWGRIVGSLKSDLANCQKLNEAKDIENARLKSNAIDADKQIAKADARTRKAQLAAQKAEEDALKAKTVLKNKEAKKVSEFDRAAAVKAIAGQPKSKQGDYKPSYDANIKRERPKGLDQARGGKPDDLKRIKGIGPKLEKLCFSLGFFHFDQIAAWTNSELAWVDDNLDGFKGRADRDQWIAQAKRLAKSG